MSTLNYRSPVDQLLSYGTCKGSQVQEWPDYVQELGLSADHIPDLIQMVQDQRLWRLFFEDPGSDAEAIESEGWDPDVAFWAPIHAWRALGQLRAAEAVKPLAIVLQQQNIDWCWEELPQVFALIGAGAIQPLDELLAGDMDHGSKITLCSGLTKIAERFPDQRDRCVEVLTRHLSHYEQQHFSLNGALIANLINLNAVEAAPTMEAAYAADKVDEMFVGSWPRVQVDLGLKQESDFTAEELAIHYTPEQEQLMANIRAALNQRKPRAVDMGLPIKREAFMVEKPPLFKDIAPRKGAKPLAPKSGFGNSAQSGSKKR